VSIVRDHMVEYIEPQFGRQSRQDVSFSGSFVMLFASVVHNVMGAAWRERASVGKDCLEVGTSNSGILNLGAKKASTDQVDVWMQLLGVVIIESRTQRLT
jgi:hypothetical protein